VDLTRRLDGQFDDCPRPRGRRSVRAWRHLTRKVASLRRFCRSHRFGHPPLSSNAAACRTHEKGTVAAATLSTEIGARSRLTLPRMPPD